MPTWISNGLLKLNMPKTNIYPQSFPTSCQIMASRIFWLFNFNSPLLLLFFFNNSYLVIKSFKIYPESDYFSLSPLLTPQLKSPSFLSGLLLIISYLIFQHRAANMSLFKPKSDCVTFWPIIFQRCSMFLRTYKNWLLLSV